MVRLALAWQQFFARSSGTLLSLGLGAYLVWRGRSIGTHILDWLAACVLVLSLAQRMTRRLSRLQPRNAARLDFELFTQIGLLVYAIVLHLPGDLQGPAYPLVYVVAMLAAAFARPVAAVASVAFLVALETALVWFGIETEPLDLALHAGLILTFASLSLWVLRGEINRVRRLSRERIDGELSRIKDAARSYRLVDGAGRDLLVGSPTSQRLSPRGQDARDVERMLRSSVEEIKLAVGFALDLLRRSLNLRSAALLWLDSSTGNLLTREVSTELSEVPTGPVDPGEGIAAAALASKKPVCLSARQAQRAAILCPEAQAPTGLVCAAPLLENGLARGLLVVDREPAGRLSAPEQELLEAIAGFVLRAVNNERLFVQLQRAKVEQGKLYRAVDLLSEARNEVEVIEAGVSSAREFTAFQFAAVTLFRRSERSHEICAISGVGSEHLVGRSFKHNGGLVSMVVANQHPLPYRGDYDPQRQVVFSHELTPPEFPSLLVLPLLVHDRVLGTIVLGSEERHAFGDSVRHTLEVLARHIAVSLENARMMKRLEDLATTDGLTGLLNKRALTETARQKLLAAARFKKPLSLLICDIDHFKRVNDTYGHDVGDLVIKGLGELLRRVKRETDNVGRFGGEEFVVVCEETDLDGATLLAERIRSELETTTFHTPEGPLRVTCSVGVAQDGLAGREWETLFRAADEALYGSKRAGRNRVTAWNQSMRGAA